MVRHPLRTLLIGTGISMAAVSGVYLGGGLLSMLPIEMEVIAWNNIRVVSGLAILGCLMAAVGYGNE